MRRAVLFARRNVYMGLCIKCVAKNYAADLNGVSTEQTGV